MNNNKETSSLQKSIERTIKEGVPGFYNWLGNNDYIITLELGKYPKILTSSDGGIGITVWRDFTSLDAIFRWAGNVSNWRRDVQFEGQPILKIKPKLNVLYVNKDLDWLHKQKEKIDKGKEFGELFGTIDVIKNPNYHKLNQNTERNDRLLHACMAAYVKHHLGNDEIGWSQLSDILGDAISNELGDRFQLWLEQVSSEESV